MLEAKCEAKLEFLPGGGGRGCKTKTFCGGGGSMGIFWNCALHVWGTMEFLEFVRYGQVLVRLGDCRYLLLTLQKIKLADLI